MTGPDWELDTDQADNHSRAEHGIDTHVGWWSFEPPTSLQLGTHGPWTRPV